MFKNIISFVLILTMLLPFNSIYGSAVEYSNVKGLPVSGTFSLTHSVARDSYFKTTLSTSDIQEAGRTTLGRFFVRNNTRDGYSVTLASANKGTMAPTGTDDGEQAIPYDIEIAKTGTVGSGVSADLNHSSADLNAEVTILSLSGDSVTTATNAAFNLSINITDDDNALELAGEFSDTITLTYTDL